MAVKMAVVKNLVTVKGLKVAANFGVGGSEGLPRSGKKKKHWLLIIMKRHVAQPSSSSGSARN
jgi:hypothetical protein